MSGAKTLAPIGADVLYKWAEKGNFVWLVTGRLRVRSTLIGAVSLIRERAEPVNLHASFEISPDPKDFPQEQLRAKVISPEAMA